MKTQNYAILTMLSMCLLLAGCSDLTLEGEKENSKLQPEVTELADNHLLGKKATVQRQTFTVPFPPNPSVDFVPVPAPCLQLGEPLRMSGVWSGWFQVITAPNGLVHVTERIDYSQITLKTDELTWVAGPGASEAISASIDENVTIPLDPGDVGESAFNVIHEFHARFISQNGVSDLRVSHRIRQLLGPDGEMRKNEFIPFTAECIGM